jgi:hypothetical protein
MYGSWLHCSAVWFCVKGQVLVAESRKSRRSAAWELVLLPSETELWESGVRASGVRASGM